jgi:Rho termination factor, N-terminal domain
MTRFPFAFEPAYRMVDRVLGVTPSSTWVEVTDDHFEARFGPWRVRTPITNVASAAVSGPYSVPKTIGPAHLSFRDRGLTFATTSAQGVCVTFLRPVRGIDPAGIIRHPALTVTVDDPAALVEVLRGSSVDQADPDDLRVVQEAEDELHTMTTRQLRDLADDRGIRHTSSMKKAELVDLLEAQLDERLVDELAPSETRS